MIHIFPAPSSKFAQTLRRRKKTYCVGVPGAFGVMSATNRAFLSRENLYWYDEEGWQGGADEIEIAEASKGRISSLGDDGLKTVSSALPEQWNGHSLHGMDSVLSHLQLRCFNTLYRLPDQSKVYQTHIKSRHTEQIDSLSGTTFSKALTSPVEPRQSPQSQDGEPGRQPFADVEST